MKALFFMTHPGHLRNFESTLRELARRGHRVHVAFDREKEGLSAEALVAALREYDELSVGAAPAPEPGEEWTLVAWQLRAVLDYLRYLEPPFEHAHRLRERAAVQVPKPLRTPAARGLTASLERSVPPRQSVLRFISRQQPDVVLVTPLLDLGSPQLDYVRGAKALGVPTCLCVASWDNLTNKGLLHELPSAVAVWNDAQLREAAELHRVPEERIVITGAQAYDHWFGWEPGPPPADPFVLYAGSSRFLVPDEAGFSLRWARAVREADDVRIVVRPHPLNPFGLAETDGVVVRRGLNPVDDATRANYFDSLCQASAVVGINTSALIEAAIAGRPVLIPVLPELAAGQTQTLHFRYLLAENGGPAASAQSLEEHVAQLVRTLRGDLPVPVPATGFLRSFVRPYGLDEPATPRLVAAIEDVATLPAGKLEPAPALATAARPLLALGGSLGLRVRRRRAARNVPDRRLSSVR